MKLAIAIAVTLAVHLLLGGIVHFLAALLLRPGRANGGKRRRRWAAWAVNAGTLVRFAPLCLGLLAVAMTVQFWTSERGMARTFDVWIDPWPFLVIGALSTSGCIGILRAGSLESHGRVRSARRRVRLPGLLTSIGSAGLLVLTGVELLVRSPFRRTVLAGPPPVSYFVAFAMLCLAGGGFAALLAGLSRKPRPSAYLAALFYLAGLTCMVAIHQTADPIETHSETVRRGTCPTSAPELPSAPYPAPGIDPAPTAVLT